MYQQARRHEMMMQRLLPEVPCFKPQSAFAKEEEQEQEEEEEEQERAVEVRKLESPNSQQMEETHEVRPLQQVLDASPSEELPPVSEPVPTSSQSLSVFEMLEGGDKVQPQTITLSKTDADSAVADTLCEPVLVPLTMESAMNNFPVRVSLVPLILIICLQKCTHD